MEMWAKVGTDAGFIVLAVDSGGPRALDREQSLDEVCTGEKLIGQERAGDIAAAFTFAAARPDIDPDRIIAAGWSHGAWTLMDYLALAARGANPPSIIGDVAAMDPAGVILFYPYCGEGAWSRLAPWKTNASVIAFIAGSDTMVDGRQCLMQLQRLSKQGTNIELIDYPDADHVFDDAGLEGGEFARYYSPADAADAAMRYRSFINAIRGRSEATDAAKTAPQN
jgi:dienelactone hydrolase